VSDIEKAARLYQSGCFHIKQKPVPGGLADVIQGLPQTDDNTAPVEGFSAI